MMVPKPSSSARLSASRIAALAALLLLAFGPAPQAQVGERILRHSDVVIQNALVQMWPDILDIPTVWLTEHFAIYYLQSHFPDEAC